jgi:REP-associated tyrosine transposase
MMTEKRRQSLRLPHYDYATPGAYFVTICVENRKCLLGEVAAGAMVLS